VNSLSGNEVKSRRVTRPDLDSVQLAASAAGLAAGGVAYGLHLGSLASALWILTTAAALAPAVATVSRDLLHRRAGVDIVAVLAMAGSLAVGEFVAGAVIALMVTTGRALEARASARARSELRGLLERTPTVVHRVDGETVVTVSLDAVCPGDRLLVTAGEVVPVDGVVIGDAALVDESALTGETALVEIAVGESVRSGILNAGGPLRLRATASAANSTYAGVVRLVREAEGSRAPLVRMADRFALWFVPVTVIAAAAAALVTHDPVRGVAVLVVATPCPLILAAPIALVGGMSRAARRGVIVKSGAALETLGRAAVVLFDKTGTVTEGRARVAEVEVGGVMSADEVVRLAASLDQVSTHALAAPIVRAAGDRGLALALPEDVAEDAGRGIRGRVGPQQVALGRASYAAGTAAVPPWAQKVRRRTAREGMANVFVAVDGVLVGALVLDDPLRPDASRALQRLRDAGIRRLVMVTGDHQNVAASVATFLGVDAVFAERSPAAKVEVVKAERAAGVTVMVGDGINDAPALACADVGVAMGVRGATASSEAADVVLMVDRIDRLADAVQIAQRSHRIAMQSILAGMGLSFVAMGAAAAGFLVPVVGAVVQEVIDVAVILNALRAHLPSRGTHPPPDAIAAGQRLLADHADLRAGTARLREIADELGDASAASALADVAAAHAFLVGRLLPHELDEEQRLYPAVAPYVGGSEALIAARRHHAVVAHLTRELGSMLEDIEPAAPTPEDLAGLRRVLYGLHAVLSIHRAEEEERISRFVDEPGKVPVAK
jgi:heavy metal translocating P-type ATPase